MSDFWIYVHIGLKHVLDISAYDHVLFLIALTVPYAFKDWKKVLLLVSVFTIGHTLALLMSVYEVVAVNVILVEFLIPVTILMTALFNLINSRKSNKNENISIISLITLFFGLIHGLGFSNYFKAVLPGDPSDKLIPLLEFALGIELAQIIVVLAVLVLSYIVQTFLRFAKRDYILIMSAFVAGVVVPMLIESEIWK